MSDELNAMAGAYALDALGEDERVVFEQHLTTCRDCADEVRSFQAAAAELSHISATPAPPELRGGLLGAIGRVRPLPPTTENAVRFRPSRMQRWLWPAVAAACAVVAVVAAGWGYQQHRSADRSGAQVSALYSLLTAPDAATVTGRVGASGQATMVFSKNERRMVFVASGIPPVGKTRTYQLWTMTSAGTASSVGIFTPDSRGEVVVRSSGDLSNAATVGVSIEPAGGSAKPTPTGIVTTIPL
jgi:anti-sigma-K factor RskA